MKTILGLCAIVSLFALQSGCTAPADADDAIRPAVAFEGKLDPRFVGEWKVTKGQSVYTFDKSGAFSLKGTVDNHGQKLQLDTKGSWLVDGDKMLIKDAGGNVATYTYKLDGDKLTLTATGTMKMATAMVRQR